MEMTVLAACYLEHLPVRMQTCICSFIAEIQLVAMW